MKKMYLTPRVEVVKINQSVSLLSGTPVNSTGGNIFGGTVSGSSGTGRSRECDWDDEW